MTKPARKQWHFLVFSLLAFGATVMAQPAHISVRPLASNIIVPQSRAVSFAPDRRQAIRITSIDVKIDIIESTAATTIEIHLQNNTSRRQEAELIVPVPDGAVVRGFAYDGPGGMITAEVLPKDEAKRIYRQLVSKVRDPALVEFVGYNLIRSNVFPVEARGRQKIRLTYDHLLESDGNRIDYVLPRTESLEYAVPWNIAADIRSKRPICTVYSASHKLDIKRISNKHLTVKITTDAVKTPGPFRLSYLVGEGDMTASMFAYPDKKVGGGYFLLLAGLPAEPAGDGEDAIKREVTLVIDRSGSMRNEKIEQVKEAALQILSGLDKGETFNIIIYNDTVESFSKKPVKKNKKTTASAAGYIEGVTAMGGTNIHEALKTALDQEPTEGYLPIVLFLTDGLPTEKIPTDAASSPLVSVLMSTPRCSKRSPKPPAPRLNSFCPGRMSRSRSQRSSNALPAPSSPMPNLKLPQNRVIPPSAGHATYCLPFWETSSRATSSSCWVSTSGMIR